MNQSQADSGIPSRFNQTRKRSREIKAWSQNLGHENVATTLTSYGAIDPHQQGEIIASISLEEAQPDGAVLAKIRALVGA
jgi:hypothetical protein